MQTRSGENSYSVETPFSVVRSAYETFVVVSGQQSDVIASKSYPEPGTAMVAESDFPPKVVNPLATTIWMARHQEDSISFQRLVNEWAEQRGASSSLREIVLCEACQSIIGMGERAVPLILRQILSEGDDPDQWFWALQMITQADPVASEDRGNFVRMARAWLEWGERNGHV